MRALIFTLLAAFLGQAQANIDRSKLESVLHPTTKPVRH